MEIHVLDVLKFKKWRKKCLCLYVSFVDMITFEGAYGLEEKLVGVILVLKFKLKPNLNTQQDFDFDQNFTKWNQIFLGTLISKV